MPRVTRSHSAKPVLSVRFRLVRNGRDEAYIVRILYVKRGDDMTGWAHLGAEIVDRIGMLLDT